MTNKVITSQDGNGKGLDNTFPDGDNPVAGNPFAIGTTAITIQLDGSKSSEILGVVNGTAGQSCYMTFSETRDASTTDDIPFPVGSTVSIPNTGGKLRVIGSYSDIELRLFYSKGVS
jgi:hypothetical protein